MRWSATGRDADGHDFSDSENYPNSGPQEVDSCS